MTTTQAHILFSRLVRHILRSRVDNRDRRQDIEQTIWMLLHQRSLPDDPDQAKAIIYRCTRQAIREDWRSRAGSEAVAAVNSCGALSADPIYRVPILPCGEWLLSYPPHLRSLAQHLGNGGSCRDLYEIGGEAKIRKDFAELRQFLESRRNCSTVR